MITFKHRVITFIHHWVITFIDTLMICYQLLELIQWFLDIYTCFHHAQSASHYSTRNVHIIKSVVSLTNIPTAQTVLLEFLNLFLFWVANTWNGLHCLYRYILLYIPFFALELTLLQFSPVNNSLLCNN